MYEIKIDRLEVDDNCVVVEVNEMELTLRKDQIKNYKEQKINGELIKTVEIDTNVAVQRGLYVG